MAKVKAPVRSARILEIVAESVRDDLVERPNTALVRVSTREASVPGLIRQAGAGAQPDPADVLSPTQVRVFLDCPARWWFRFGLGLPEPKNSSLALGLAVHRALEINFREKLATGEDLPATGVRAVFRDEWLQHIRETVFAPGENATAIAAMGERLLAKYMDEVAPRIEPAAVECDVEGEIAGVQVRGRIDLLDRSGRIIDIKTSARRPRGVAPDYAFQLATYRQICPGASGEARLDTLVRTQFVQIVPLAYRIKEQDLRATHMLYPLARDGMRSGLYWPNRQSMLCSRRQCGFWRECEREFGGMVKDS